MRWAWQAFQQWLAAMELLALFGWKQAATGAAFMLGTTAWAFLAGWRGPVLLVLMVWALAGAVALTIALDRKRAVRADLLIGQAAAEARAEVRRRYAALEAEDAERLRRLLAQLIELRDYGEGFADGARLPPAVRARHSALAARMNIINDDIDNWILRVGACLKPSALAEYGTFMNCGDGPAANRYECHMARLNDLIARLEAKAKAAPVS